MKTFFQYDLKTVLINGNIVENAKVVVSERCGTQLVGNELEVSSKNSGLDIIGKVYIQEEDTFVKFDDEEEEKEVSQLDRIETYLLDLQAIEAEKVYQSALAEIGG